MFFLEIGMEPGDTKSDVERSEIKRKNVSLIFHLSKTKGCKHNNQQKIHICKTIRTKNRLFVVSFKNVTHSLVRSKCY